MRVVSGNETAVWVGAEARTRSAGAYSRVPCRWKSDFDGQRHAPPRRSLTVRLEGASDDQMAGDTKELKCLVATALVLALAACSQLSEATRPAQDKSTPRAELSIGYSLLYQEVNGLRKLKWVLMFKEKSSDMGKLTEELVNYYQQLADSMRNLSKQYPAMHIEVAPMSAIESEERKAIGTEQAKQLAPLVGKTGVDFEREALLIFYDALNEQRHLTGVMVGLETEPPLRKFLESTKIRLDAYHGKVGALLNRSYFTH